MAATPSSSPRWERMPAGLLHVHVHAPNLVVQSRTCLQVGLLIGRLGTSKDSLLFLAKTPLQVLHLCTPGPRHSSDCSAAHQRDSFRDKARVRASALLRRCRWRVTESGAGRCWGGQDGVAAVCEGAPAGQGARLDTEWILEHASQLTRMLPGGEPRCRQHQWELCPQQT